MSVWFVTGASRGFGAEIVDQALAAGHDVVATARDPRAITMRFPDAADRLLAVALDVTDEAAAAAAVDAAVQQFGRIDVVVNNAGRGVLGAVEEISDAAATVGAVREHARDVNHEQPGDPVKAVAAILRLADAERPPLRVQLGSDSFGAVAHKLATVAEEQADWRELAMSTDFDAVAD